MADLISLTNLLVDPTKYTPRDDINALLDDGIKKSLYPKLIVSDQSGKLFLRTNYFVRNQQEDQKFFFRSISFMHQARSYTSLFGKLEGFSFFDSTGDSMNFSIFSEFPENGFFLDFYRKIQTGIITDFTNTCKSKFLYGAAFIGNFLHSRKIIHRYFSPPVFGVSGDYTPVLLLMSTSKSSSDDLNSTILPTDEKWSPPIYEEEISSENSYDIFTFGLLAYFLQTGENPFASSKSSHEIHIKKLNAINEISLDFPDPIKNLLESCWCDPNNCLSFGDILLYFQSHDYLFPGTDLNEFDRYVQELQSLTITSPISSVVSPKLTKSVKNLYQSVLTCNNYPKKYDIDFLNSLYTIREQTETYEPFTITIQRAGADNRCLLQVPKFMFISALQERIAYILLVPSIYQQIYIVDQDHLITQRYLTLEQLGIRNGTELVVYNRFGNETFNSPQLHLNVYNSCDCTEPTNYSIGYIESDTLNSLFHDIFFLTRIPIQEIELHINGTKYKYNDDYKKEILKNLGILANQTISVKTSFRNTTFHLDVNLHSCRDKDTEHNYGVNLNHKVLEVNQLTKISEIIHMCRWDINHCVALDGGNVLSNYKSLLDYGLLDKSSLSIHEKKS